MDCVDKNEKQDRQDQTTDRQLNNEKPNRSRRAIVPAIGVAVGASMLPSQWRRPVIDTILLPAHAQTTVTPINPDWILTAVTTALGVPSGEVVPVETYTRLRLSGCGLLPGTTISVDATALITPSGEIPLITGASVTTATGSFNEFINVDSGVIVVTSVVDAVQFDIDVDGEAFSYTANAAAIGAAAAGTAVAVSC